MKRYTYFLCDQPSCNQFNEQLEHGWIVDPKTPPMKLDVAAIYSLICFDSEEEKEQYLAGDIPLGTEADSLMLVDIPQADSYLKQGYRIATMPTSSAKQVILIKGRNNGVSVQKVSEGV